jgi:hypothetical protein
MLPFSFLSLIQEKWSVKINSFCIEHPGQRAVINNAVPVIGYSEVAPVIRKPFPAFHKTEVFMSRKEDEVLVFREGIGPSVLGYVQLSFGTDDENPRIQFPPGVDKAPFTQELAA